MKNKLEETFNETAKMAEPSLPVSTQIDMFYHLAAMNSLLTSLLLVKGILHEEELLNIFSSENIEEVVSKLKQASPIMKETTQTN